jgi:hypothetical protein
LECCQRRLSVFISRLALKVKGQIPGNISWHVLTGKAFRQAEGFSGSIDGLGRKIRPAEKMIQYDGKKTR